MIPQPLFKKGDKVNWKFHPEPKPLSVNNLYFLMPSSCFNCAPNKPKWYVELGDQQGWQPEDKLVLESTL